MQITVVGAGYGGLRAVQELALYGHQVTLIEPRAQHVLRPRLISAVTLRRPLKEVQIDYPKLLPPGVRWIQGTAVGLDPENAQIDTDYTSIPGDRVILALGSTVNRRIAGSEKVGFSLYSLEEAQAVLAHWAGVQKDLENQKCAPGVLRWVVVGGGITGVELAAELTHLARRWRARYGGQAQTIQIHLIHQGDSLLPGWRPALAEWVMGWLVRHKVIVQTRTKVKRARPEFIVLEKEGITEELATRTLFWTTGFRPLKLEEEPEGLRTPEGFLRINDFCQLPDHPRCYGLGDQVLFSYPPSAQLAVQTAQAVVDNIQAEDQHRELRSFEPLIDRVALSVGAFDGAAMFQDQDLTGTPAWTIAQAADTLYVNTIQNWNLLNLDRR